MTAITIQGLRLFSDADYEALVESLHAEDDSLDVEFELWEERGQYLLTALPIDFFLDHVTDAAIGVVLTGAITWARDRLRKGNRMPIVVNLYGPDGKVLRRVRITEPDGEAEELGDDP